MDAELIEDELTNDVLADDKPIEIVLESKAAEEGKETLELPHVP